MHGRDRSDRNTSCAGADKRRFHVEERPQDDLRYQAGVQQQQPDRV